MSIQNGWIGLLSGVLGLCVGSEAWAQAAPPATVAPQEAAAAPAPVAPAAAPAPAVAPAPAAPPTGVPPGYMLVPVPAPAPQYPPPREAPGMELPYDDRQPIPPGYRVVEQRRRGLIIAGSIVTGIPWAFSVTGAVAADFDNKSGFLLIPGIGPWLMLAAGGAKDRDCGPDDFDSVCNADKSGLRAVLVLDALAQTAGTIMFVAGMTSTRKRLVRNDVLVGVAPVRMGKDGYGLGVHGSF